MIVVSVNEAGCHNELLNVVCAASTSAFRAVKSTPDGFVSDLKPEVELQCSSQLKYLHCSSCSHNSLLFAQ